MVDVPRSAVLFERRRVESERRTTRRKPFVAAVRSAPASGVMNELALSVDLSETGMRLRRCVRMESRAPIFVRLEFELPDGGEPIVAAGRLLFEDDDGATGYRAAGIRFIGLDEEEQARIARFVRAPR
jgi:c-di-GMP-binding flagellar brake protein YcgR